METINSIFVECRKWHDKIAGNTYYSNRILIDGCLVRQTGMAYGYGAQYLWGALNTLFEMELIPTKDFDELRKMGIAIYNSETFGLKRDLFRDYNPATEDN